MYQKWHAAIKYKINIINILIEFCRQTSIHGFWFIQHGVYWIAWALFTKIMISVCLWQCGLNIKEYFSFRVQTATRTDVFESLEFPSISFCPQIPFKASGLRRFSLSKFYMASSLTANKTRIDYLANEVRTFFILGLGSLLIGKTGENLPKAQICRFPRTSLEHTVPCILHDNEPHFL